MFKLVPIYVNKNCKENRNFNTELVVARRSFIEFAVHGLYDQFDMVGYTPSKIMKINVEFYYWFDLRTTHLKDFHSPFDQLCIEAYTVHTGCYSLLLQYLGHNFSPWMKFNSTPSPQVAMAWENSGAERVKFGKPSYLLSYW